MNNKALCLLSLFLAVLGVISNSEAETESENFTLTKEDEFFWLTGLNQRQLLGQDRVMILFYYKKHDCPKCQKAKESLSKLIPLYSGHFPGDPNFFIVNCDHDHELCRTRLKTRSIPALDFRVNGKDTAYVGDFSSKSLEEFLKPRLTDRIEKYNSVGFLKLKEAQNKQQTVIAVLKQRDQGPIDRIFQNLMRYEPKDHFIDCDGKVDCLLLFDNEPSANLLLIVNDRQLFLTLSRDIPFPELALTFHDFKDPLFIPFGPEFDKKVLTDMNPTLVFIVDNNSEETEAAIKAFHAQAKRHAKQLFASLIRRHQLTGKDLALFDRFAEEIGIDGYPLPLMLMVEPDMETLRLQKYYFSMSKYEEPLIQSYIERWFNRQLSPVPKNENQHPPVLAGFRVISHEDFKERIFKAGLESVVLVHNGLDKCAKSKAYLKIMTALSKETQFKNLNFALINAKKNDLPVFLSRVPSLLIFTEDLWEYPITFDKPDATLMEAAKILRERKELAKAFKLDEQMPDDFLTDL